MAHASNASNHWHLETGDRRVKFKASLCYIHLPLKVNELLLIFLLSTKQYYKLIRLTRNLQSAKYNYKTYIFSSYSINAVEKPHKKHSSKIRSSVIHENWKNYNKIQ